MPQKKIFESIDIAAEVFNKLESTPVFFGSFIGAAINGNFYREVEDIDVLAELKYAEQIKNYFKKSGFSMRTNREFGIISVLGEKWCPTEFSDGVHKFSFIFGNYKHDYFEIILNGGFSFRWPKEELSQGYNFQGRRFIGFSPEFHFILLLLARKQKEKRKKDRAVISGKVNHDKLLSLARKDFIFFHGRSIPFFRHVQYYFIKFLSR